MAPGAPRRQGERDSQSCLHRCRRKLLLLHGRGVDESDLYPLLDALDPEAGLAGATPRAPLTLPPGGHHWYIVERVGFPHRETFIESFELLTQWLAALAEAQLGSAEAADALVPTRELRAEYQRAYQDAQS